MEWKHGLCGCFDDCGICLLTTFFPCYPFGKAAEAVGESCLLCGILLATPLNWIVLPIVRQKMREAQGIPGSIIGDCCLGFCCACCVVAQMAQEATHMGVHPIAMERE